MEKSESGENMKKILLLSLNSIDAPNKLPN